MKKKINDCDRKKILNQLKNTVQEKRKNFQKGLSEKIGGFNRVILVDTIKSNALKVGEREESKQKKGIGREKRLEMILSFKSELTLVIYHYGKSKQ